MPNKTLKGYKLAEKIKSNNVEVCSLIARHAKTHHKLSEDECNGHPAMGNPLVDIRTANKLQERFAKWIDKRNAQIESRIRTLALQLPEVKSVNFSGDPRGATVKLIMKDGSYDDWGHTGICVPI